MTARARLHVVIPAYNEFHVLPTTLGTLIPFLKRECPYPWTLAVADNGSTDGTPAVLRALARLYPQLETIHVPRRGRGAALKQAWAASDAEVLAYMDADLSTDLRALRALVDPVADGRADLAVGSRHLPGSQITRSVTRDVLSRGYNRLLRLVFHTPLTDAQCGFKAVSRRVVEDLVPRVQNDGWFFDTELLLLAEHHGYRIAEVPVRWVEDPDSRVRVPQTILEYLRELWRLQRTWRAQTLADPPRLSRRWSLAAPPTRGAPGRAGRPTPPPDGG